MNKVRIGNGMVIISECELQELVSFKENYDRLLEENTTIKEANKALSEETQETKNAYYELHKSVTKEVTKLREKIDNLLQEKHINDKCTNSIVKNNEELKQENETLKKDIETLKNMIQELIEKSDYLIEENENITSLYKRLRENAKEQVKDYSKEIERLKLAITMLKP